MEHADYPHFAGTLWDCDACESECHCEKFPPFKCVHCDKSSRSERDH